MLAIESCVPWTFLSVAVFAALVMPSTTLPNDRLDGDSVTGTTPVPVSAAINGLPGWSWAKTSDDARGPNTPGVKRTDSVHVLPGASTAGGAQPGVAAKSAACPPLTVTDSSVTGASRVFLKLMVRAALVSPTT